MTISGIVAEFNPFHNGHKYLLDQAQGLKIVVMSGNFVQRGEPALIDKWTRAQMALENGADLVVELPFLAAVQSADYFAQGAISILSQLGVDSLVFGTEELIDYQRISEVYGEKAEQMAVFLERLPDSLSYPQKTQKMWEEFAQVAFTGDSPNHILGLAYAKACADTSIQLRPILRQGAGYHSKEQKVTFASATSLRHHRQDSDFLAQFMPNSDLLKSSVQVTWEDYFDFLRYQVVTCPDLTAIFQVNHELANRIRSAIGSVATVEELVEKVATKRYTKARVRRVLTYILVNAQESPLPKGIHVLAFSQQGQAHLKSLKKSLDLVTRIGADVWDPMTQQADKVYQLGNSAMLEQTWGRVPVRVED